MCLIFYASHHKSVESNVEMSQGGRHEYTLDAQDDNLEFRSHVIDSQGSDITEPQGCSSSQPNISEGLSSVSSPNK